eukprot:TRINITY_DN1609_c0_g1_i1.p1 TRINITY_DN1609_c0_g1~~TRINITY_DN1609_c0_g1_i1.p1  ORF type:complete len:191 (+),score=9.05 TRINITY_DN1609_c0_g1_i1:83-574(+)
MRRHYNILHRGIGGETPAYNLTTYYDWAGPPTTTPATAGNNSFIWPFEPDARQGKRYALSFLVKPRHPFASLYAAWAGHMKYRFVLKLVLPEDLPPVPFNPPKVGFFPFPPRLQRTRRTPYFAALVAYYRFAYGYARVQRRRLVFVQRTNQNPIPLRPIRNYL